MGNTLPLRKPAEEEAVMPRWLLGVLGVLAAAPSCTAAEARPNLVIVLADDLGWSDVGFNGRTEWATPHLDRLAAQGTVFRRWYTAAVVCAPSRAALLTGRYGIHNGVSGNADDLPAGAVTLAEVLRRHGYATGLFGKWHHGRPRPPARDYRHPLDLGFQEFFGFTDAREAWEQYPRELWSAREKKPVTGYANTLFTDRAVDFMHRHRDRPFFLYLPYTIPHFHIQAPAEDVAPFAGKFAEKDPRNPVNATYAAMITRLDREVGRVLAALDELGLRERTLVVFSSDHGATFEAGNQGASAFHDSNRPFRGQKRTLWEGGLRVPAAVCWPGRVPAGKVSEEVVHMTDVFPSFLAAAGIEPQAAWQLDGRDLLGVWQGRAPAPERTLFWEWRAEGYYQLAALRGRFKLVLTGSQPPELFDVVGDPGERRSVLAEHGELARRLRGELDTWLKTETEESKWGKSPPRP
jgi:arylsulfatase A-like enzyme